MESVSYKVSSINILEDNSEICFCLEKIGYNSSISVRCSNKGENVFKLDIIISDYNNGITSIIQPIQVNTSVDIEKGKEYPLSYGAFIMKMSENQYNFVDEQDANDADVLCRIYRRGFFTWEFTWVDDFDSSKFDMDVMIAQTIISWIVGE